MRILITAFGLLASTTSVVGHSMFQEMWVNGYGLTFPLFFCHFLPPSSLPSLLNLVLIALTIQTRARECLLVTVLSQVSHPMIYDAMLVDLRVLLEYALHQVCSFYVRIPYVGSDESCKLAQI